MLVAKGPICLLAVLQLCLLDLLVSDRDRLFLRVLVYLIILFIFHLIV